MSMLRGILILTAILIMGCASKTYVPVPEVTMVEGERFKSAETVPADQENTERFVQFEAALTLNTQTPDSVHRSVNMLAVKFNGYILHAESNSTVIRIPSDHFTNAVKIIETLGEVSNKEIKGEDVTEQYYDLNTRLESNIKIKERYLELLKMANNVESALKVEKEIERINKEIDLLTGQLNRMKHLVRYSTISVYTGKQVRPGPVGYIFYGIYEGIKWLFVWD
jgi:ATP-dependent Lon protease